LDIEPKNQKEYKLFEIDKGLSIIKRRTLRGITDTFAKRSKKILPL